MSYGESEKKIAVALGGGAARGLAHVGVLQVLLREGIRPDLIVGTSMGALVGALFAVHMDAGRVLEKLHSYFHCDSFQKIRNHFSKVADENNSSAGFFGWLSHYLQQSILYNVSLTRQSYVSIEDFMENISFVVDDISVQDTQVPLAIVCTDIHAGKEVVVTEGSLITAAAASAAIPGIFPPIELGGMLLVDGGWVDQLPVAPCRGLGADIVIAVDVAKELEHDYSLSNAFQILRRTNAITRNTLYQLQMKDADLVISPDVGGVHWADFECVEVCIKKGVEAAEDSLPAIRSLFKKPSIISRFLSR